MRKYFKLSCALVFALSFAHSNSSIGKEVAAKKCRVTCKVTVPDGFGNAIIEEATAGGSFTSCQAAKDEACEKAFEEANSHINDL